MSNKVRQDIYFGGDGMRRLQRLTSGSGEKAAQVVHEALIEYELRQSFYRDAIQAAVLNLDTALWIDESTDPTEDTRREEAERVLGELLNNHVAAQGIALALNKINTRKFPADDETETRPVRPK